MWEGGGGKTALEDNGQEGTKRPQELSINTQGKDSIHTATAASSRCQSWGQWPQARKATLDTQENNPFPSVITGGRRLEKVEEREREKEGGGKKGKEEVREEGREERGGGSPLCPRFSSVFTQSAPCLSSGFLPVIPVRTQSHPLSLLDGKLQQ